MDAQKVAKKFSATQVPLGQAVEILNIEDGIDREAFNEVSPTFKSFTRQS